MPGGIGPGANVWKGALKMKSWDATSFSPKNGAGDAYAGNITFNASKSNAIYGNSNTVQPPALAAKFLIKY